jgi:exopolysaccharide biosynthesis polyprenyl glycosylphosphotransferase
MNSRTGLVGDDADVDEGRFTQSTATETVAEAPPGWSTNGVSRGAVLRDLLNSEPWRVRLLVVYDALVAWFAVKMGYALSPSYGGALQESARHLDAATMAPVFAAAFVLIAFAWGMYESKCLETRGSAIIPVTGAVATTWCLVILVDYTVTYSAIGRWIVAISGFGLCGAAILPRIVLHLYTNDSFKRIIVIGNKHDARLIDVASKERGDRPIKILHILEGASEAGSVGESSGNLKEFCLRHEVDLIVAGDRCDDEMLAQAAACLQTGTQVCGFTHYYEHMFHKVPVERIDVGWIFSANLQRRSPLARMLKRGADLILATAGLIVTLPLWPIIAVLVKATSKGPVLYTQRRVGQGGAIFSLMKFRTMFQGAERQGRAVWASKDDPRVTFVGRILRKTRLDEIPQFLNVLNGEMSFVGPRPERPEFVGRLQEILPHYGLRHIIKPGITGWAQVMYRYGASESDAKEKLCYDLYYVKYGNVILDLKILVRTVGAMVKGAR